MRKFEQSSQNTVNIGTQAATLPTSHTYIAPSVVSPTSKAKSNDKMTVLNTVYYNKIIMTIISLQIVQIDACVDVVLS